MCRTAAVLGVVVLAAGCGSAPPRLSHLVGEVSTTSDTVCVAAPEATGNCFVRDSRTSSLSLGDCVDVEYRVSDVAGPARATEVHRLSAASNPDACPPGLDITP